MKSHEVKRMMRSLGADLVGIAPVERFQNAPDGFHPKDVFPETQSVIGFARRFPAGVFESDSPVPYKFATSQSLDDVFRITYDSLIKFQDKGIMAVPIPSEPYEYWDVDNLEGKGMLSLRHIGYLTGMGALGRNTLLVNELYGNSICLGALLVNVALQADPVVDINPCAAGCNICIDGCPSGALDGVKADQSKCRPYSSSITPKGNEFYTCNLCRKRCPNRDGFGSKKTQMMRLL